jgi:hypothetical protein
MKRLFILVSLTLFSCGPHNQKFASPLIDSINCRAHEVPKPEILDTQSFRGYVSLRDDKNGIPGVLVVARNSKDGSITTAKTDSQGRFELAQLNPGTYEVVSCLEGFDPWVGYITLKKKSPSAELHLQMTLGM